MNQKKSNKTNRKEFLKKTALGLASISIVPRFVLGGKGYTAPSDKITIGFIGNGKQGTILANPFIGLNDTQIIACSDVDSVKQTKFMEWANRKYAEASNHSTYYGCRAYADYEDILERDDIDAVIVCT